MDSATFDLGAFLTVSLASTVYGLGVYCLTSNANASCLFW